MLYPMSTGQAARFLRTTETRLAELVRRGRIEDPPPVLAGRRLWAHEHVFAAARALGKLEDVEIRGRLAGWEVPR